MELNNTSFLSRTTQDTSASKNQRVQIVDASEIGKLDQNAFLNMLLTQLQNQDPLNPLDNTEFAAQLAQYSSLEQLTTISGKIDTITELLLSQTIKPGTGTNNNTTDSDSSVSSDDSTNDKPDTPKDTDNSTSSNQNSHANTITFARDFTYSDDNLSSKINSLIKKNIKNTYLKN